MTKKQIRNIGLTDPRVEPRIDVGLVPWDIQNWYMYVAQKLRDGGFRHCMVTMNRNEMLNAKTLLKSFNASAVLDWINWSNGDPSGRVSRYYDAYTIRKPILKNAPTLGVAELTGEFYAAVFWKHHDRTADSKKSIYFEADPTELLVASDWLEEHGKFTNIMHMLRHIATPGIARRASSYSGGGDFDPGEREKLWQQRLNS